VQRQPPLRPSAVEGKEAEPVRIRATDVTPAQAGSFTVPLGTGMLQIR
jgi:hypothetical protein